MHLITKALSQNAGKFQTFLKAQKTKFINAFNAYKYKTIYSN